MPTYSLDISDFIETSFSLFGIKTSLDDFRLAYFLNKQLKTRFEKTENNLEFEQNKTKQSFSLFNYEDLYNYNEWFLISNKFAQTGI
ncbi:MAG TPA: IPExxxVDY family protein, partial [Flavobacteriaceae bacterium]|nr:IPExxxVDY family protein [Flavobacteriaceae bacterium]